MQTKSFLTTFTAVGLFAGLAAAQNDLCSNALDIGTGATSVPFDTTGAADESGPPTCAGGHPTPDLWYSWTPAATGSHWLHTCGASFNAVLTVYDACGGNEIDCGNSGAGQPPPCTFMINDATILLDVVAGTTYLIRVGGWNGDTGAGVLTIVDNTATAPPNDACAAAQPLDSCGGESIAFDTSIASTSGYTPTCGGVEPIDIWYSITPTTSGTLELDTCDSQFDTRIAVLDGCGGTVLACNDDDDSTCGAMQTDFVSRLSLDVTAGLTYVIQIGGFSISNGVGVLNVGPVLSAPQNYCTTGVSGGSIGVTGASSLSVAANDFTVEATGVPDTAGLVFFGENQGADPFGAGFRCVLAGPLGTVRTMPGIASGGTASRTIDLSSSPILAGSCWNFQYWFRRNDLPELFDLTDAVTVPFAP